MPQRITPSKILTVTKDGELHITLTLDLNINLNAAGVSMAAPSQETIVKKQEQEGDEVHWAVPDFSAADNFQFGKEV